MDSAILTVMNKIGEVLSLAAAEYRRVADVDAQVRDLRSKLQFLMAWIQMAEDRSRDQLVRVWVSQIREAVCAAEDIVEEYCHEMFMSRRPGLETTEARRRWQPLSTWFPFPVKEVSVRYSLSQRISGVLLQLEGIRSNSLLDMPNRVDGGVPIFDRPSIYSATILEYHGSKRRPTGGIPRQFIKRFEEIYVDEYTNAIRTTLLDDNRKHRAIVTITGESGIGKSTVAKEFLQDRVVLRHFDICAWVCLPPESRLDRFWDQIYQQAQEQIHCDSTKREDVKQLLVRRKYLVVLDGMDNMVKLKSLLRELPPDGANGSGILVTTQLLSEEIRHTIPDVTRVVEMKCLERSNCLALFDKWVCIGTEAAVKDYSIFQDKIYLITRGLPLAIVLLAGLLYCKDHLSQWHEVFKLLESYEHMRLIKRILTVSLTTMPPVVKLCFLYLAAMPQNVQLDEDILITLWCAEGFFESEDRDEATEEEIAERCYSVLVLRGLVQPGKAPFFKPTIHENVHNFTKKIAWETNFLECSSQFDIRNASIVRRLSIHNYVDRHLQMISSFPKLRTLLGDFAEDRAGQVANPHNPTLQRQGNSLMSSFRGSKALRRTSRLDFLCQSKFLRVVDLQGARLGMLPDSIGDLIHLRYLSLRSCSLTDLPQSVARLLNLETLDITGNDVHTIVAEFWISEKLKHVLAKDLSLPESMGTLRKLMTLHGVKASSLWTHNNCPFNEMKSLLSVEMLSITDIVVEMLVMALVKLDSPLHHLRLVGDSIHPMVLSCDLNSLRSLELDGNLVLEKFGTGKMFLPPNLYRLVLRSTCICQELFDKICGDATIELELLDNSFRGPKLSFEENGFERLRKLKIGNLGALEELVIGESSLRYLDTIEVFGCPNMKSIKGLENVYDLDHMVFYEMPAVVDQIKADDQQLFDKIKHLRANARANTH
ncbi:hypothetical protein QOZ80_2BG0163780 [Eleusine coracana subsp. coracana]|nr:hypothetical protein QOZ80_2BG0163780 [Eleusine coracana subsp. coracana]